MDFILKSAYAAAEKINDIPSSVEPINKSFVETIDEYRLWIMFISLIIALISLGWQVGKHILDNKKESKKRIEDKNLSIDEGFWHKSVILPVFVDKFVESISNWTDMLNNCTNEKVDETRDAFIKEKRELSSRTRLLCTVNESSRENIRGYLDDIEETVMAHLFSISKNDNNSKSLNDRIYINVEKIFKELIKDHHQLASNSVS